LNGTITTQHSTSVLDSAEIENGASTLRRSSKRFRRGISTVWVVAAAPALLAVLVLVTDLARIWLARVELETAVEAGALAGARSWGGANDVDPIADQQKARNTAVVFTEANGVVGSYVPITNNFASTLANNTNLSCAGNVIFGNVSRLDVNGVAYQFQASVEVSSISHEDRGVTVIATANVTSFWQSLFGLPLGPYKITAQATARWTNSSGTPQPQLIRVSLFSC
jgi:uncharacterized membrane protein